MKAPIVPGVKPGVRLPSSDCPHCAAAHDGASGMQTHNPEPGDVSVCFECSGISIFGAGLKRFHWPPGEAIPPEVVEAQRLVRTHRGLS